MEGVGEKDLVYKIVPNFNLDDVSDKVADFTTSKADDDKRDYGTEVIINEITGNYPQKKTTELPHERCCAFLNDDEGGGRLAGAAVMVVVRCFLFYLSSSFFSSR